MTRAMRKTLIIFGGVLALLLLLLILLPVLFGGRIAERVKTEANRSLNAKVDWRDAGLSLFGNFPNLTLGLDGLTVVGVGKFEGDTLAAIRRLGVVIDLASARAQRPRGLSAGRGAGDRAGSPSALAGEAEGRLGQLGHHQEGHDGRGAGRHGRSQADGHQSPPLRDRQRRRRGGQPGREPQGLGGGIRPVSRGGLRSRPAHDRDPRACRRGERRVRRDPLPQEGPSRPQHRRRRGSGQEELHASRRAGSVSTS